jgi:hypothetical protein
MNEQLLAGQVLTVHEAMTIASMSVGLVFAYAAVSKLVDMPGFTAGVRGYGMMPVRLVPAVAGLLVLCEGLFALAHLTGVALNVVLPGAIALLTVFAVTMVSLLRRGDKRPCLCFGASRDDLVDASSLIRLAVLLAVEGILFFYLRINDGSLSVFGGGLYRSAVTVGLAGLVVALSGWCFALPKFYRAVYVVRS